MDDASALLQVAELVSELSTVSILIVILYALWREYRVLALRHYEFLERVFNEEKKQERSVQQTSAEAALGKPADDTRD